MKTINNLKIGARLAIVFTLIVLVTTFGFVYTSLQTRSMKGELDKIYQINLLGMEYLIEADRDAYQSSLAISHLLAKTEAERTQVKDKLVKDVSDNLSQVEMRYGKFENISDVVNASENRSINQQFHENYSKLGSLTKNIIGLIQDENMVEASAIYFGQYAVVFEAMRGAMDQFTTISLENAEKSYNESVSLSERVLANSISLTILIIVFIIITGVVITRSITKPIEASVGYLDKISKGDLTIAIPAELVERKDEGGDLVRSMSEMVTKLNRLISEVKGNAKQIISASQELNTTSQQLSEGANEQASSVEEVSSTMEQINANIQQNSTNAIETQKIADASFRGINEVNKSSQESLKSISDISGKINIINDIAFQTNILALNAAVEAARAGEHGKGFAVVAAEVRKLAERSKLAADEIVHLSESSVRITKNAVEQMDRITPEISKTFNLVQEIASASQEQSNGANQVNNAIQQLNSITQQNASASEELASNAEQLLAQADTLFELISQFKTLDTNS